MIPGLESSRFFSGMAVGVIEIAKYLNSNDKGGGGLKRKAFIILAQTYRVVIHELNIIDKVLTCWLGQSSCRGRGSHAGDLIYEMTGNGHLNIMHKLLNKHRDVTKTHHTGRQLHGSVNQSDDWYASLSVIGCASSI